MRRVGDDKFTWSASFDNTSDYFEMWWVQHRQYVDTHNESQWFLFKTEFTATPALSGWKVGQQGAFGESYYLPENWIVL